MQGRLAALLAALSALLVPGCAEAGDGYTGSVGSDGVREVKVHIGWNDDHETQYMTPSLITVQQGDKVRFVVINDDDPSVDYDGGSPGFRDSFHDVALDYPGACKRNPIEHETPAGRRATTECDGKDYFVADKVGRFSVVCEVQTRPSHAARGMSATFVVEAAA